MNRKISETGRKKLITKEEYNQILNLAESNFRDYALLSLIGHYGLRVGEVVRLRIQDINAKAKTINIPTLKRDKNRTGTIKKGKLPESYILFPLPQNDIIGLVRYISHYGIKEGWLFKWSSGSHLPEERAKNIFYRYAKQIGVNASIHSLRHLRGSTIYEETMQIRMVQIALRHKSISSSMVYTEPTLEMISKILKPIGEKGATILQ